MMVALQEIERGKACHLRAMRTGPDYPLLGFLREQQTNHETEYDKLMRLLSHVAERGPPNNKEKCRYIPNEKLFEFKTGGGLRVFAFWGAERKMIVCTHGFVKKSQKTPSNELDNAVAARKADYEAEKQGGVVHE